MGKPSRKKDQEGEGTSGGNISEPSERVDGTAARRPSSEGPTLADIMQAITASREALETKIDTLATDMGILRDDHRRLSERVTTVEREMTEVPSSLLSMKERLDGMEAKVNTLEIRAEGAENRSRRNNIWVIGVPEGTEKGRSEWWISWKTGCKRRWCLRAYLPFLYWKELIECQHGLLGPEPLPDQ